MPRPEIAWCFNTASSFRGAKTTYASPVPVTGHGIRDRVIHLIRCSPVWAFTVRGGSARSREAVRIEPWLPGERRRHQTTMRNRVVTSERSAGASWPRCGTPRMLTGSSAGPRSRRFRGASRDFLGFPGASRLAAFGQHSDAEKAPMCARYGRSQVVLVLPSVCRFRQVAL